MSKNDETFIQTKELCIKNKEFRIKNDACFSEYSEGQSTHQEIYNRGEFCTAPISHKFCKCTINLNPAHCDFRASFSDGRALMSIDILCVCSSSVTMDPHLGLF